MHNENNFFRIQTEPFYQAIVHCEKRTIRQRKEGKGSGIILYLGYRLDKKQVAPALIRSRWTSDEADTESEENYDEKDIEVREEVETRGLHGKVSLLCEVIFPSSVHTIQTTLCKENRKLRESVHNMEVGRRSLEERVEKLEAWAGQAATQ